MLDDQLKSQLSAYLERVQQPFELVASLGDSDTAREMLDQGELATMWRQQTAMVLLD